MSLRRLRICVTPLAGLICFGLLGVTARADVQLTLTQPPGPNDLGAYGIYMNPYVATIDGVPGRQVICDDFLDELYTGEVWTAHVNKYDGTVASLLGTRMATLTGWTGTSLLNAYAEVAWLSDQLLMPGSDRVNLSFAIWSVFEPTDVATRVVNGPDTEIGHWLAQAQSNINAGIGILSNIYIYSPDHIISGGSGTPQELLWVDPPTVSEASSFYILTFELSVLLAVAFVIRRRLATRR